MAAKKKVVKTTEKTKPFTKMDDALNFIDQLALRRPKVHGYLNATWYVTWEEPSGRKSPAVLSNS